jgi:hypothetical protein
MTLNKTLVCLLAMMLCGQILAAKVKYITVELDSTFCYATSVSIQDARIQTLQALRKAALEKSLPQDITISSLISKMSVERNDMFDERVASSIFMNSTSSGRIMEEKVLLDKPEIDHKQQLLKYRMRYHAKVMPVKATYNPSLDIEINLSECVLHDKEEFSLSLKPNQDGYLYIFDFLSDDTVALVFPTLLLKDNLLPGHEVWQKQLTAVVGKDQQHSIETLYFVFSTEPIAGWEDFKSNLSATELVFSAGGESFTLFNRWLSKSDPAKRTENMAQLHIFK